MSTVVPRGRIVVPAPRAGWPRHLVPRVVGAAAAFGVASAVDVLTERRWSSVWGSLAILASLLVVVPGVCRQMLPVGGYAGAWVGFNLLRARADEAGWTSGLLDVVPRLEARLGGGRLPSAVLQDRLFDPYRPGWHDTALTVVHLSFFVVPHVVAGVLLWRNRARFRRYLAATLLVFAVGVVAFALLPTNPPWLAAQAGEAATPVARVADVVLAELDIPLGDEAGRAGQDQRYAFEPNPVASMPSIHLAITVLLAFVARGTARPWLVLAVAYAVTMAVALVYLGEHHLLDLAAGALLAAAAWRLAPQASGAMNSTSLPSGSSTYMVREGRTGCWPERTASPCAARASRVASKAAGGTARARWWRVRGGEKGAASVGSWTSTTIAGSSAVAAPARRKTGLVRSGGEMTSRPRRSR